MGDDDHTQRPTVVPFRPTPEWATRRIRALAAKSEKIFFGSHAEKRMVERDIFDSGTLTVLRKGDVEGEITRTEYDEWKCKVVYRLRGNREVGVVVIIQPGDTLFVKTVEWEDMR